MQLPILSGIYTDGDTRFRTAYPRNLRPVPKDTGIAAGYLAQAEGITLFATGAGADRGGINWNGTCYRVMGTSLVSVGSSGVITTIGTIAGADYVRFDYSFDYLSISGGSNLYLYNGTTLTQVTDADLGIVRDAMWVDGYFMTTDGTYLVVTELNDPFSVNPLKYGSSEVDPDPVMALLKVRNEPHALNRYTIEAFDNVGGELFPFQRIEGAQIQKGTVGRNACCLYMDAIAFVGGGRNEPVSVYVGANGNAVKISTDEIDDTFSEYTEAVLRDCVVEARKVGAHDLLYIHLNDITLVYDGSASKALDRSVWYTLTSSVVGNGRYRARGHVWCYGKWIAGDPTSTTLGTLTDELSTHYGAENGWEFSTAIVYNESRGAVFHSLELVSLTGRISGVDPVVWASYSLDGMSWSTEIPKAAGKYGERNRRIAWLQNGFMRDWRIQKFRGTSDAHIAIARLEAQLEPLNV